MRTKIEEILGRGAPSGGGEIRHNCPFCLSRGYGEDRSGHLYVNENKGVFNCFKCGVKGTTQYLHNLLGIQNEIVSPAAPTEDTLEEVRGFLEGNISVREKLEYPCEVDPVVPGTKGYIYLCGARGYPDWVIHEHKIVEGVHPKFGRRIFVPTFVEGKMKYWVGRAIDGQNPKYINPSIPKTCVFNLNNVPKGRPLLICEGVFSAISCHPWAVAIYGKTVTSAQLLSLQKFNPPMYFVILDGDAHREAATLAESLVSTGKPVQIIELPFDEDPASLPPGALWKLPMYTYDSVSRLGRELLR